MLGAIGQGPQQQVQVAPKYYAQEIKFAIGFTNGDVLFLKDRSQLNAPQHLQPLRPPEVVRHFI